jgi:hypothetical protein
MKKPAIFLIFVFLFLGSFVNADDNTTHAGKAEFQIPDGWVRLRNTQNVVLIPEDLPKGKTAYIAILEPRKLDTTLSQWFKDEWQQLQTSYVVLDGGEPETQIAKAGYETISLAAKVRDQQNKISLVWLMGAHVNDRVERFLFLCNEENDVERYQKGLTSFLATLTFEDVPAQPQTSQQ